MRSIRKQWFGEHAMWICGHATASCLHDQIGMNTSPAGL